MHSSKLENSLIVIDIVDVMQDYVSIQIDIDETKVKAAALVAQNIDIKRLIGRDNLQRAVDPQTEADEELKDIIIPPLCYFTYSRCLKMFQGTFTDSGYTTETEAEDRNSAKSVANEMSSIAESYMSLVIDFLNEEDPNSEIVKPEKIAPRIRTFGGEENRASN